MESEVKKKVGSCDMSWEKEDEDGKGRKNNLASREGIREEEFGFSRGYKVCVLKECLIWSWPSSLCVKFGFGCMHY